MFCFQVAIKGLWLKKLKKQFPVILSTFLLLHLFTKQKLNSGIRASAGLTGSQFNKKMFLNHTLFKTLLFKHGVQQSIFEYPTNLISEDY